MKKIHSLLVAACLLAASCNREEIQPETDKAGMYHITVLPLVRCEKSPKNPYAVLLPKK